MSQTNVREEYRIITLEVVELIEDLISYSLSVMSNRSTALITDKFSVALLTELAILNNANVTLVDAIYYSVIDALMITLIKDDNNLLGTVNSYIKPPLKRCKTKAADSRHAKASRRRTKKDKDLEDSNTSSDVLRLHSLLDSDDYCLDSSSNINSKDDLEDEEATIAKDLLIDAYILYFKELLSNNSRIFANAIGIGKTRAIMLAVLIGYFCFFSNSPLENIGRLTKEEAIEMRINTTNAIFKALAAANKLTILEANTPAVHSKAIKHCLALLAAQFIIVYSFRKVDKHMFRAYNTISVIAQRTIIRKDSSYIEKRAILLSSYQQCRDILEKESLNKSEASRRIIFNCFKMQAIASYSALTTLKAAYVKDLFTNLSKDYFLVREARAITKSSLKFQNLLNLCSKVKILGTLS
ncbi:hypothetical protein HBI57_027530 [Parastagonospora nodorum]|nr:hypothetical protein HBI57_027530 [Parastagonospora nodorum]KAH6497937.1 hypothetical protein HBI58_041710 [Parastagonospora nodorum]